jgi:hypothetical protein
MRGGREKGREALLPSPRPGGPDNPGPVRTGGDGCGPSGAGRP